MKDKLAQLEQLLVRGGRAENPATIRAALRIVVAGRTTRESRSALDDLKKHENPAGPAVVFEIVLRGLSLAIESAYDSMALALDEGSERESRIPAARSALEAAALSWWLLGADRKESGERVSQYCAAGRKRHSAFLNVDNGAAEGAKALPTMTTMVDGLGRASKWVSPLTPAQLWNVAAGHTHHQLWTQKIRADVLRWSRKGVSFEEVLEACSVWTLAEATRELLGRLGGDATALPLTHELLETHYG